jgi:type II secretory pathway pseudopilin PulG
MKKIGFTILGLLVVALIIVIGYLIVFPTIDRSVCVQQVSNRIGVASSYESIIRYVSSVVKKGMDRNEIEIALRKLGPLDIHYFEAGITSESSDSILIKMCTNSINNFWVHVKYNADGKLESFFIDWD